MITQTLDLVKHSIEEKSLKMESALQANSDIVYADAPRLQQILWNIIKNAIKFTQQDGKIAIYTRNIELKPTLKQDDFEGDEIPVDPNSPVNRVKLNSQVQCIEIRIVDNGIGIEEPALSKLFQPFEQGDPTITHQFGGLGLGLSVSKMLAQLHYGILSGTR